VSAKANPFALREAEQRRTLERLIRPCRERWEQKGLDAEKIIAALAEGAKRRLVEILVGDCEPRRKALVNARARLLAPGSDLRVFVDHGEVPDGAKVSVGEAAFKFLRVLEAFDPGGFPSFWLYGDPRKAPTRGRRPVRSGRWLDAKLRTLGVPTRDRRRLCAAITKGVSRSADWGWELRGRR